MSRPAGRDDMPNVSVSFDEAVMRIAALAERVLGRPVDPGRNFFEAGLDSLALVAVHDLVCAEFACDLPPTTLFEHPNVMAVAALIGDGEGAPGDAAKARDRRDRSVQRRGDLRRRARRARR